MASSISLINPEKTMSSREIADLCGKRHDHVMRDIREMLGEVAPRFGGYYIAENGKENPCFDLPFRETMIVVSGYKTDIRTKIIDRWIELEDNKPPLHLPGNIDDIAMILRDTVKDEVQKALQGFAPKRKEIKKAVKDEARLVVKEMGDRCPCCNRSVTPFELRYDHYYNNQNRSGEAVWAICEPCHKEFTHNDELRVTERAAFDNYQLVRRRMLNRSPIKQMNLL